MRKLLFVIVLNIPLITYGQSQVIELTPKMFNDLEQIQLATLDGWIFKPGHDPAWAGRNISVSDWQDFKPVNLTPDLEDEERRVEGWFRIRIKLSDSMAGIPLAVDRKMWSATDIYLDGNLISSFGSTGGNDGVFKEFNPDRQLPVPLDLEPGKDYVLAIHFVDLSHLLILRDFRLRPENLQSLLNIVGPGYQDYAENDFLDHFTYSTVALSMTALLMLFFWIAAAMNPSITIFRQVAILTTLVFTMAFAHYFNFLFESTFISKIWVGVYWAWIAQVVIGLDLIITESIIKRKIPYVTKVILIIYPITGIIAHTYDQSIPWTIVNSAMLLYYGYLIVLVRRTITGAQLAVVIGMLFFTLGTMLWIGLHKYYYHLFIEWDHFVIVTSILSIPISLMIYLALRFNDILSEIKQKADGLLKLSEEKKDILANQNIKLEKQVSERTAELNESLENLKATQSQLVHSEKMASLGELTAGIAHEIQNPLNFINNFSDVNKELVEELREEIKKGNGQEAEAILKDIEENEEKILHHGKRADGIVKGMLQHSRSGGGEKEPTDINELADEYLRLAYHGLRAKDKSLPGRQAGFNADFKTDLDPKLPKVNVVPQDIGRVLLNLINNAFYAVSEREKEVSAEALEARDQNSEADPSSTSGPTRDYKPQVILSTRWVDSPLGAGGSVEISIQDNGPGVPEDIKDKIFQPFFTTKSTGEGTGLGLSLSYDIVTKGHGGTIEVDSDQGNGTEFIITLPVE